MREAKTVITCDLCGEFCADSRRIDTEEYQFASPIGPIPYHVFQAEYWENRHLVPSARKPPAEVIVCHRCLDKPVNDVLTFAGEGF